VDVSEWENLTAKSVIASKSMSAEKIHHKINRNLKQVSVIACIAAAGESQTPYRVTFQDPLPV
jgi:hypothetical protein